MSRNPDALMLALRSTELTWSLAVICEQLGIASDDVAVSEFTRNDYVTYAAFDRPDQRAEFIRSWLVAELFAAAHRAQRAIDDELLLAEKRASQCQ